MSREEAELDRLVRLARQADLPDAARLARVRARFLPPTAAPTPAPSGAAETSKGILGAKIVVGLAAIGLGVWSYLNLEHPSPELPVVAPALQAMEPPPPAPPPEREATSAGSPAEPAQLEQPIETSIRPRAKKPRAKPVTAAPASTLAQEAALLQLVAVQLRAGQLESARASLAEFAQRYPESALNADRERLERRLAQAQPAP